MTRALQTLVLSRGGIGEPAFSSIEEWLGGNTEDYYRVLAATGGGGWHPDRPTELWVKFNPRAHHVQDPAVELCPPGRDRAADRHPGSDPAHPAGLLRRADQGTGTT